MVSAEQAVVVMRVEIEADVEKAKAGYNRFLLNYAKTNSSFARTLRTYGLDFLSRVSKPANPFFSDLSLIQQFEKCLELDRIAINLHSKAVGELSKSKELRYKESLVDFEKSLVFYNASLNKGVSLLVDFQSLVFKKDEVPLCILEPKLLVSRKQLRLHQLALERIFLDVLSICLMAFLIVIFLSIKILRMPLSIFLPF